MQKMILVNLPVADVAKSVAFYEALGFTRDMRFSQPGVGEAVQWSDTVLFMLLSHDFFAGFVPAGKAIADARTTTEMLMALSLPDRGAVDAMTEAAGANGGKADVREKEDHGFMYGRSFEDPDGHIFEPHFMDIEAMLATQSGEKAVA